MLILMGILACPTSVCVMQSAQTCLLMGHSLCMCEQSGDCLAISGFRAVEAVEWIRASDAIDFKGTFSSFVDTLLVKFLSTLMTLVHGFLCLSHGF